jgi:sialate O-acetylesterase
MGVLELPHTGIANLIDTCEDGDLHPLNKQDAGTRLAQVALANVYGLRDVTASGPVLDSVSFAAGKATVTFQHATNGLRAQKLPAAYHPNLRKPEIPERPLELPSPDSEIQGFALCEMRSQPDGSLSPHWEFANAKIDGNRVIVWSPHIAKPEAVRYAWADHPVCNLVNADGLPAFPFRTDQFPPAASQKK